MTTTCEACIYMGECDPRHKDDSTDCDGFTEADPRQGIDRNVILGELAKAELTYQGKMFTLAQRVAPKVVAYMEEPTTGCREELVSLLTRLARYVTEDGALQDLKARI